MHHAGHRVPQPVASAPARSLAAGGSPPHPGAPENLDTGLQLLLSVDVNRLQLPRPAALSPSEQLGQIKTWRIRQTDS